MSLKKLKNDCCLQEEKKDVFAALSKDPQKGPCLLFFFGGGDNRWPYNEQRLFFGERMIPTLAVFQMRNSRYSCICRMEWPILVCTSNDLKKNYLHTVGIISMEWPAHFSLFLSGPSPNRETVSEQNEKKNYQLREVLCVITNKLLGIQQVQKTSGKHDRKYIHIYSVYRENVVTYKIAP